MFMVHVQRRLRRWRLRMRSLFVAKSWTVIASEAKQSRIVSEPAAWIASSRSPSSGRPKAGPLGSSQ
jgi:hypothetical protein